MIDSDINIVVAINKFVVAVETERCDGSTVYGNAVMINNDRAFTVAHLIHHSKHVGEASFKGEDANGTMWFIEPKPRMCCAFRIEKFNNTPEEFVPDLCEIKFGTVSVDAGYKLLEPHLGSLGQRDLAEEKLVNGLQLVGVANSKLLTESFSIKNQLLNSAVSIFNRNYDTNEVSIVNSKIVRVVHHKWCVFQLADSLPPGFSGSPVFSVVSGRLSFVGIVFQSYSRGAYCIGAPLGIQKLMEVSQSLYSCFTNILRVPSNRVEKEMNILDIAVKANSVHFIGASEYLEFLPNAPRRSGCLVDNSTEVEANIERIFSSAKHANDASKLYTINHYSGLHNSSCCYWYPAKPPFHSGPGMRVLLVRKSDSEVDGLKFDTSSWQPNSFKTILKTNKYLKASVHLHTTIALHTSVADKYVLSLTSCNFRYLEPTLESRTPYETNFSDCIFQWGDVDPDTNGGIDKLPVAIAVPLLAASSTAHDTKSFSFHNGRPSTLFPDIRQLVQSVMNFVVSDQFCTETLMKYVVSSAGTDGDIWKATRRGFCEVAALNAYDADESSGHRRTMMYPVLSKTKVEAALTSQATLKGPTFEWAPPPAWL